MKATGIVRRIDDLGRVVIPKEIRRTMRIREGSPLEIYTGVSGEVIFKKYSPVGELTAFAGDYAEALSKGTELTAVICDEDTVIAVAGPLKKELAGKGISDAVRALMKDRQKHVGGDSAPCAIENGEALAVVVYPIISCGDVGGAVLLVSDRPVTPADSDIKLALAAADFLGRQLED